MVDSIQANAHRTIIDTNTSNTHIYVGKAERSASTSDPVWLIKQIDLSTGADIQWASSTANQVWDDRATLSYI